jgi:hypothetical protein
VLAKPLDIRQQMFGSVRRQIRGGGVGKRPATPTPPLVEQHRPVRRRVEAAPITRAAATARVAMQVHRGRRVRVADRLSVDLMPIPHIEHPRHERLDLRAPLVHRPRLGRVRSKLLGADTRTLGVARA